MFTQASRYSFETEEARQEGGLIYIEAKELWIEAGASSVQRFRIMEGPHADQQMVVVRFPNHETWQQARAFIADKRAALMKELEGVGVKLEETLLLDEVIAPK